MLRPLGNVASFQNSRNLAAAEAAGREALEIAIRLNAGDRRTLIEANLALGLWFSGGWDEVAALATDVVADDSNGNQWLSTLLAGLVAVARGSFDAGVFAHVADDLAIDAIEDPYLRATFGLCKALVASEKGDWAAASDRSFLLDRAESLMQPVTDAPPGLVTPLVHAQLLRLRGMIAAARGDASGAEADLAAAADGLRAFGARYYLARTLLSLAEVRRDSGLPASELLDEARAIFENLGARPWVEATRLAAAQVPA
jgi:nucleotide-binding universal stress UspA family protein